MGTKSRLSRLSRPRMKSPIRSLAVLLMTLLASAAVAQSSAIDFVASGERALATGEYFTAIEEFQSALAINANYADALAGIAEAYYWLSEYDQAAVFADQAVHAAGDQPALLTLSGRIAIGRGNLEAADRYFGRARLLEPNNVDARLGQAELAVAQGQSTEAIAALERSLLINPEHRKTLLSLVLIYEQTGREDVARDYLELARRVHRDSTEVHVVAAQFFARRGDFAGARNAAETALAISPESPAALRLVGESAMMQDDYATARQVSESLLMMNRNDVQAWYTRAVAQYRLGNVDAAFTSIRTALAIDDEDELARMWAEWAAIGELPLDHEIRAELADERREFARELAAAFRFDQALRAYRRALQLSPVDLDLRAEFAELNRRAGHDATYLRELELLVENGRSTPEIERAIEVFTESLGSSVAFDWAVDQFTLERRRTRVGIYAPESMTLSGYPEAVESLLTFVRRTVSGETGVNVADSAMVEGFSEAYERARASDVDYFIQLQTDSAMRTFGVSGTLFVGRTGAPVTAAQSVRSGPGRVTGAVDSFVARLVRQLPPSARIVERSGQRVLIDRGERDGIAVDAEFIVLDPTAVTLAPAALGFSYSQDAVLGTLSITEVDELVAEGDVEVSGFVDVIAPGDLVTVATPEEADAARAPLFPVLDRKSVV